MTADIERIRNALWYVPADDRDMWVRMGQAVKSELGEDGHSLWDDWSQTSDNYKAAEAKSAWRSFKDGSVRIGSLFYEAKANGWHDDQAYQPPSPEELAQRKQQAAAKKAQSEQEQQAKHQKAADMANKILNASTKPAPADNPYLERKQVKPAAFLREIEAEAANQILGYVLKSNGQPLTGRLLVVPIQIEGQISTLELIAANGAKTALAGGAKADGYWRSEKLPEGTGTGLTLLIGEGVATVLTAREATGNPAIAALTNSNLKAVAQQMRQKYPKAQIILLADLSKTDGKPDSKATEAAAEVGGLVAVPEVGDAWQTGLTDFNDMAQLKGIEAVRLALQNPINPADLMWPEPQPIIGSYDREPYPLEELPDTIRAAVKEVAESIQAPIPVLAACALSSVSLAAQAYADVKRDESLTGPTGLYFLTIADSGERKSACDGHFNKAIKDYEAEEQEKAKPVVKQYKAELKAWEAKQSGLKTRISQFSVKGDSTYKAEQELVQLEHEEPTPPRVPRLIYGDATQEALTSSLKRWPSGGIISAEAGQFLGSHGMSKDNAMRNMSALNQLWSGESITIDRKTSESFTLQGARLTIGLQIQEATLKEFFEKSGTLARGSGFLARFLVSWPESTKGQRFFKSAPEGLPALTAFNRKLRMILDQSAPIADHGGLEPVILPLSPEAKQVWVEFHDKIEWQLGAGGELYDVSDVASKTADNAARLAALFHVFEQGGTGAISEDHMKQAATIAAWHLLEARRFFGELALDAATQDAVKLDRWLISCCQKEQASEVNRGRAQQFGPVRDASRLKAALEKLAKLGRFKEVEQGKKKTIKVNPALLSGVSDATS